MWTVNVFCKEELYIIALVKAGSNMAALRQNA